MKHPMTTLHAGLAGAILLAIPFLPQQEDEEERQLRPEDVFGPQSNDLEEEMKRLFLEVEANLKSIDIELADAGAGIAPLEDLSDSGIEKLLLSANASGEQVISDIDRILEIAEELGGT
jgi:hypothetical protein